MFRSQTPPIRDRQGQVVPGSVALLEKVTLGGLPQQILIRGKNVNNPVLLMLHGGPGSSQIGFARKLFAELEDDFVVVNWDQRGSGMSFPRNLPRETMTIEQFESDTLELINLLRERFHKDRIFLAGHSWGTVLGTLVAASHPELLHAYIGVGQVGAMARNEEISYDYALNWAKSTNNQTAVKQLERIGKPPYRDGLKGLMVQRKLLDKSGGGNTHKGSAGGILGKTALKCTEYTLPTMFRWLQGMTFSSTIILEQLMKVDFVSTVRELRVPTYILAGQYDYQTVIPLARQFYEQLQAPRKEFIVFADCAHCALFEKPHDFAEVLRRVKRETIG